MKASMWNRRYWVDSGHFTSEDLTTLLTSVGFTVFGKVEHHFNSAAHSLVWLLGESHLAIHTFPEEALTYVELTSCNEELLLQFDRIFRARASQKDCRVRNALLLPPSGGSFIDDTNHVLVEALPDGSYWLGRFSRLLVHEHTPFQEFAIVDGPRGRSLYIDGYLQSRESTEHAYHEMLVHPALIGLASATSVLVIGGGEGAVVRELVRYPELERIVMVDIDERLLMASREYLGRWHRGALDDPRVEVRIEDATAYIGRCDEKYDVVLLDLPSVLSSRTANLSAIAMHYRDRGFYESVASILNTDGVVASYFADFFDDLDALWQVRAAVTTALPFFWLYRVNGILLKMFVASRNDIDIYNVNRLSPGPTWIKTQVDEGIIARVSSPLSYYNGAEHIASFAQSNDMLRWVTNDERISEP